MDFTWGNRTVRLDTIRGAVMSSAKWSETHVSSSGGGGSVHNGSGYVAAPQISSTVTAKHEFWVKTDDGREIPVQLTDADFPLAAGQRITLISAPKAGTEAHRWIFVHNHNADQRWILNRATDETTKELRGSFGLPFIAVFAVLLILGFWLHWIFGLAAFGYLGFRLFQRRRQFKEIRANLCDRAKALSMQASASPAA
jgi:hypothetical protein